MTTHSQRRLSVWQLALPTIAGNVLFAAVSLVQTKFVGQLGAEAVAAVGVGQRVFFMLQAVLTAIGVGTAASVARAWGAGDRREAGRVTMASLLMASGASLIVMLIGTTFSFEIALLFGLDAHTTELAAKNIFWLSIFMVGFAINIVLAGALRAAGDTWTPLLFVVAVNIVNLPLLYTFILGHFGAPAMGAAGASFATGLSLTLCGAVLVTLWVKQQLTIEFVSGVRRHTEHFRQLFRIGSPAALEQVVMQLGLFAFLALIGHFYGTEAFAAYSVGANMLNIAIVSGFGFSVAGSTLVGQHLGAGQIDAAKRSGWQACAIAMLWMGVLGAIISFNAERLAVFFLGDQPVTIARTVELVHILAVTLPLLGVEMAIGGALRGAGDTRFPLFTTFVGLIAVRCGLATLFVWLGWPVIWVYGTMIGDYILKTVLLIWRFRSGRWAEARK